MNFVKQGVSKKEIRPRLEDHLSGTPHAKKINGILDEVHTNDAVFGPRTALLIEVAEDLDTTVFGLFNDQYFSVLNYFENRPVGSRSSCDYCFEDGLSTGFSVEFGATPSTTRQFIIGPDCLESITNTFASNKSRIKKQAEEIKKQAIREKHEYLDETINRYFESRISIDDLSLSMMEKLVGLRAEYEGEAREFMAFMQDKQQIQADYLEGFKKKYGEKLKQAVDHLNNMDVAELAQSVHAELQKTRRKGHLLGKVLDIESLPDEDRALAEKILKSTDRVSQAEFARVNALFRLYFPRNLQNSYGSIMNDIKRRHAEGNVREEAYASVRHLIEGDTKLGTGEDYLRLRYADPDVLNVRAVSNRLALQAETDYSGINPLRAFRNRLIKIQQVSSMTREDARLMKQIQERTEHIAHARVETNPSRFSKILCESTSMDEFEPIVRNLSVLARKERYQRETGADAMQSKYIDTRDFLKSADIKDTQLGAYAALLGVPIQGIQGEAAHDNISHEITLGIIDRIAHTYIQDSSFIRFQSRNRDNLLSASRSQYQLIKGDKSFLQSLVTQYEKIMDAQPIPSRFERSLQIVNEGNLLLSGKSIPSAIQSYASELRYAK